MSVELITTIILGTISTIIAIALGMIGRFLMDIKASLEKQQTENKLEIKNLREDLNDLKAELPVKFVLRDDFIRVVSNLENKMDRNFEMLNKKLDKLFEAKTGGD